MAYPTSTPVSAGETGTIDQYNSLRNDALYPIFQNFTYGETIAVNDALYLKASDGKVYKTDSSYNDERSHNFVGFAKESGNANDSKRVQISGKMQGLSGLTAGNHYYLSDTAGDISSSLGTYNTKTIGLAISTTELLIKHPTKTLTSAGEMLLNANDSEKSTGLTSYTKLKETKFGGKGTLRIKFFLENTLGGGDVKGRIYRNGSAVGTERLEYGGASGTYSEDISGWSPGDLVQIYGKEESGGECHVSNFRIYTSGDKFCVNQDP